MDVRAIIDKSVATWTSEEIKYVVDCGVALDSEIKDSKAKIDIIKDKLRELGILKNIKTFNGSGTFKAVIKKSSSSEIDPVGLFKILKRMDKTRLFSTIFKVKATEAKKYVPSDELEPITVTNTVEYGSVGFKEK